MGGAVHIAHSGAEGVAHDEPHATTDELRRVAAYATAAPVLLE